MNVMEGCAEKRPRKQALLLQAQGGNTIYKITSAHTLDPAKSTSRIYPTDTLCLHIGQMTSTQGCSLSTTIIIAKDYKDCLPRGTG